jgi:L-rhamnose mutarotase
MLPRGSKIMTKGVHLGPLPLKFLRVEAVRAPATEYLDPPVTARSCFLLHLKPSMVDAYLRDHETVWSEMLDALREAGWKNYTLFHRPSDGLVVGYVEAELDVVLQAMGDKDVNDRWQSVMAKYFEVRADQKADQSMEELVEYFHLD